MTTTTQPNSHPLELPAEIFGLWIHSREEDTGDIDVFRRDSFVFPPSFGRDGFEMKPGGDLVQRDIGPADGTVEINGRWELIGPGRVEVSFPGTRPGYTLEIVEVTDDVLRARIEDTICGPATVDELRAFQHDGYLLIVAKGTTPTPGYRVHIVQSPIRIFPPQYIVEQCELAGVSAQVISPYHVSDVFRLETPVDSVVVHHAGGRTTVAVERPGPELACYEQAVGAQGAGPCAAGADEATGFSAAKSFDEAFAQARANLPVLPPPTVADSMEEIKVAEIGALVGGIAGFDHLYVRICRTRTP